MSTLKWIQLCCMVVLWFMPPAIQIRNVSFNNMKDKTHARFFWILVVMWIGAGGGLCWTTYKDYSKRELSTQLEVISSKITTADAKIIAANAVQQRYENLVDMIVTNPAYAPDFREMVVQVERTNLHLANEVDDLNAWRAALQAALTSERRNQQIQSAIQQRENARRLRDLYLKAQPCFDYAIKQLIRMTQKAASEKEVDCQGALTLPQDVTNMLVSVIKLRTNSLWNLRVELDARDTSFLRLNMFGTGSMLALVSDGRAELHISNMKPASFRITMTNYEETIDSKLRLLVASEAEKALKPAGSARK